MIQEDRLKQLLEQIENHTAEEIKKIEQAAEEEMSSINNEYDKEKKEYMEKCQQEFEKDAGINKKRMITAEKLEAKKNILNKKREMLDGIFDDVMARVKKFRKNEYEKLVENLLIVAVVTGKERVYFAESETIFSKSYIAKLNKNNKWQLVLSGKTSEIDWGFLLKEAEFETKVDGNSIRDHIKQEEEEKVVKALFSEYHDEE